MAAYDVSKKSRHMKPCYRNRPEADYRSALFNASFWPKTASQQKTSAMTGIHPADVGSHSRLPASPPHSPASHIKKHSKKCELLAHFPIYLLALLMQKNYQKNIRNQSPSPSVILVFCSGGAFFKVFGLFLIVKLALYLIRKCVSSSHFFLLFFRGFPR